MEEFPDSSSEKIEQRLADWREEQCEWRQGDCVIQSCDFLWLTDVRYPLTEAGRNAATEDAEVAAQTFPGAVVLTQTCDVVRSCDKRPFLEVAPLIVVEPNHLAEIKRGRQPGYLFLPALEERRLVGDLSRPMAVEKSVVAGWDRIPGWEHDHEALALSRAIVRRLERFAFPNDIVQMYGKWEQRIKKKHGKASPEGQLLDQILEIRVEADPGWEADSIAVTFLCILPEGNESLEKEVLAQFPEWEALIEKPQRVASVSLDVERLSTLTAQRYLASSRMDFDHLSARKA